MIIGGNWSGGSGAGTARLSLSGSAASDLGHRLPAPSMGLPGWRDRLRGEVALCGLLGPFAAVAWLSYLFPWLLLLVAGMAIWMHLGGLRAALSTPIGRALVFAHHLRSANPARIAKITSLRRDHEDRSVACRIATPWPRKTPR